MGILEKNSKLKGLNQSIEENTNILKELNEEFYTKKKILTDQIAILKNDLDLNIKSHTDNIQSKDINTNYKLNEVMEMDKKIQLYGDKNYIN